MSRKQPDRMKNDRSYYRIEREEYVRKLDKKRALLCCFVCFLIVFVIIIAVKLIEKSRKGSSPFPSPFRKKLKDSVKLKVHDLSTAVRLPQNMSEFIKQNDKLCNEVTNKQNTGTINNPSHIYIVKLEHNITAEQACGIESILRLFPDKTIFLIDFNKHENKDYIRSSSPPNYLGLLLYLYKDRLELVLADRSEFFKNTPLQNTTMKEGNLEFFVMLVAAYKYGGFVAAPEIVMTKREFIECLPEETIVEPFAIFASKKCDEFLYYLMQSFGFCESSNVTLEQTLSQSVQLYTENQHSMKRTARRMWPSEVCTKAKDSCTFLKITNFKNEDTKWVCDLSGFCKQVVQEFLGIKLNKIEVDEETSRIKSHIKENGMKTCRTNITVVDCNSHF